MKALAQMLLGLIESAQGHRHTAHKTTGLEEDTNGAVQKVIRITRYVCLCCVCVCVFVHMSDCVFV